MIRSFQEIKNSVFRSMGLDPDDVETIINDEVEQRINTLQDDIFFDRDWEWRKSTFYLTLIKPYETGTVTVTEGSKSVTGSGTTWVDSHKDGYLLVNSKRYKIRSIDSSTSLTLESAYPDDTASAQSYKIIFPDYRLDPRINSIISVKHEGRDLDVKNDFRVVNNNVSPGLPEEVSLSNRTLDDFYNTGTIAVTNGSTALTGTGTAFTSYMEGMEIKVNEFTEPYVIRSVNSATSITIDREYQGETGSGKGYKIGAAGSQLLTFTPAPDDYYFIEITALIKPRRLVNNNDVSLIPNHSPLLHGAIWLAMTDFEDKNPVRIQQARADYERTLKQLQSSYKAVASVKWRSANEVYLRQRGGTQRFNPLEK